MVRSGRLLGGMVLPVRLFVRSLGLAGGLETVCTCVCDSATHKTAYVYITYGVRRMWICCSGVRRATVNATAPASLDMRRRRVAAPAGARMDECERPLGAQRVVPV